MSGKINLEELIQFYDQDIEGGKRCSSAINSLMGEELGAELIKHYFNNLGKGVSATILKKPCTKGTKKGKRLDRWIEVKENDKIYHYQTEIKNWSAHSFNGAVIAADAEDRILVKHRKDRWKHYFDGKTLVQERARKVLERMTPLDDDVVVRPLICFWDAMHPEGGSIPFFPVKIADPESYFETLWVFSMSNYVRHLIGRDEKLLDMDFPEVDARLKWLNRLYQTGQ